MTRKNVDWDAIERDYRAGVRTLREIADDYGITHGAVNKRAKRDGWERDLSARIQEKVKAQVSKVAVSKEVTEKRLATEQEVIEANACLIKNVILTHRSNITDARALAVDLLDELKHQTSNREDYEKLGELLRSPDEKGIDKLNELYQKAISLPGRVGSIKSLSDTLKNLVSLERQAFNVDNARDIPPPGSNESGDLYETARKIAFVLAAGVKNINQGNKE